MANEKLIVLRVSVVVADPWDFMGEPRTPLIAEVVRVGTGGQTHRRVAFYLD